MNMLPLVLHLVWSKRIRKHIVLHKSLTLTVTHSWRVLVSHFWTAFGWQLVFRQGTATSTLSTRSYLDDVIVKVEFCWCNLVQDVLCSPTMLMPLKLITCHFTEIITVWMRSDLWWLQDTVATSSHFLALISFLCLKMFGRALWPNCFVLHPSTHQISSSLHWQ